MRRSKWHLVQLAADAKRRGQLDEHAKLKKEINDFDAKCKHRRYLVAEDAEVQGDMIHLCTSCGKILRRIPSDQPSGVRLRV